MTVDVKRKSNKDLSLEMGIGEKIKTLRLAREVSQETLAKKLQVTQVLVSNWETGRVRIGLYDLCRVAKAFKVPLDELLPKNLDFLKTRRKALD